MRLLRSLFSEGTLLQAEAFAPQPRDVWLPVTEVMAARDQAQSERGLFVAAKGGHNDESHNHNDIGEFVVYLDGKPLLIDAGVETYSRKTFSERRYEIWTMQSGYHNLPTVDGVEQLPGVEFAARDVEYHADENAAQLTLDIAGAYPASLGLDHWTRTVRLNRGRSVEVEDDYALDHPPATLTMSLLTPSHVALDQPGQLTLTPADLPSGRESAAGVIVYDAARFTPSVETVPITDANRMGKVWGSQIYRIVLTAQSPQQHDHFTLEIKEA
jgi:hypothetical protein